MTTVIINSYSSGYYVQAPVDTVSIAASGTVGGYGVLFGGAGVYTVFNSGLIAATGANAGVDMAVGGMLTNAQGHTISGNQGINAGSAYYGPNNSVSSAIIINNGVILGATGARSFGVYLGYNLTNGVSLTNGSVSDTTALISGVVGVYDQVSDFTTVTGMITNFGTIQGTGGGTDGGIDVVKGTPATIVNGSALDQVALITGAVGVNLTGDAQSTIQNFGTIQGSGGTAVYLGSSADVLIDEANAVFTGAVQGAGGYLQLAGDAGAGAVSGLGTQFVNFSDIAVKAGATWTLANYNLIGNDDVLTNGGILNDTGTTVVVGTIFNGVTLSGSTALLSITSAGYVNFVGFAAGPDNGTIAITNTAALPASISGFTGSGDTIDLTSLNDGGNDAVTSFNSITDQLTVTAGANAVTLQLGKGDYTGVRWDAQPDSGTGTDVFVLCFCAGTTIATPSGEVPVEQLGVGDLVLTCSGAARPITWIGVGQVLATRGRRNAATPVIVCKNALGPNVPHRDLHVTKGHSLYLDGVLVPVEFLVNHRSIVWDDHAQEVTLYHIELETHDVLLANGAPAESYRDDGNRWLFRNANEAWDQPEKPTYAPVVTGGRIVDTLWQRLLERAGSRPGQVLTDDPDLHLVVGGCRLDARRREGAAYVFCVPAPVRSGFVRIVSRAAAPAELGLARDPRVLGVALRRVALRAGARFRVLDADDDRLVDGFHGYEPTDGLRWTDGDAALAADLFEGFAGWVEVVLYVCGMTRYLAEAACGRVAA